MKTINARQRPLTPQPYCPPGSPLSPYSMTSWPTSGVRVTQRFLLQCRSILWSSSWTSYWPFLYSAATRLSISAENNGKQTLIGPYWSILGPQGRVILHATTETPSETSWVMESSVRVQVGVAS